MKCSEVQNKLQTTIDNDSTEPVDRALKQHLQQCPACVEEWRLIREAQELLATTPVLETPPQFASAWRQAIRQAAVPESNLLTKLWERLKTKPLLPAFGGAALILIAVAFLQYSRPMAQNLTQAPQVADKVMALKAAPATEPQAESMQLRQAGSYTVEIISFGPRDKQVQRLARDFRAAREAGSFYAMRKTATPLSQFTGLTEQEAHDLKQSLEKAGATVSIHNEVNP